MSTAILIMVDGLRPDALPAARCPNLDTLFLRGSSTLKAASVVPSITLPCHMSIFHSVPPTRHGVTTNEWQPMARPLPGLVDQVKAANLKSAFFHNWEPLRNLNAPGSLAFSYYRDNVYDDQYGDQVIAREAAKYISEDEPDFAFVYFGTVDTYGHYHGWMSPEYLRQIEIVDGAIGMLLDGTSEESTIILHSDHGGHDRTHGTEAQEDMVIPWLAAGPGIRTGYVIEGAVSLLDSAPTFARILGVPAHHEWEGRCLEEIFEA